MFPKLVVYISSNLDAIPNPTPNKNMTQREIARFAFFIFNLLPKKRRPAALCRALHWHFCYLPVS